MAQNQYNFDNQYGGNKNGFGDFEFDDHAEPASNNEAPQDQ